MKRWNRPRGHRGARPSEQLRALIAASVEAARQVTERRELEDRVLRALPQPVPDREYSAERSA